MLDIDHPRDAEAVDEHAEAFGPEGLAVGLLHRAALGESVEDALAGGGVGHVDVDEEALRVLRMLRRRVGDHQDVVADGEATVQDFVAPAGRHVLIRRVLVFHQVFDLAAELEEGLLNVQSAVEEDRPSDGQNYSIEDILSDFKKGVDKQLGSEDYDTRYNLGIAYKEMGLIDEAIAEFQIAAKDQKRFLECCSMLGLCFVEKGMHKLAIKWYQRGLESPGYSEDEYQGLRFDLAQAHEAMGETERALEVFHEVYGINANYRNVSRKIKELQEQKNP